MTHFTDSELLEWQNADEAGRRQLWGTLGLNQSAELAEAWVQALFAQPWLKALHEGENPSQSQAGMAWEKAHWLLISVRHHPPAWAHALLDQGVSPNLMVADGSWGGGQALRELIDDGSNRPQLPDPGLLARLWRDTDLGQALTVIAYRLRQEDVPTQVRYLNQLQKITERILQQPELNLRPQLDAMYAEFGSKAMPHYTAFLHAEQRSAQLALQGGGDRVSRRPRS